MTTCIPLIFTHNVISVPNIGLHIYPLSPRAAPDLFHYECIDPMNLTRDNVMRGCQKPDIPGEVFTYTTTEDEWVGTYNTARGFHWPMGLYTQTSYLREMIDLLLVQAHLYQHSHLHWKMLIGLYHFFTKHVSLSIWTGFTPRGSVQNEYCKMNIANIDKSISW